MPIEKNLRDVPEERIGKASCRGSRHAENAEKEGRQGEETQEGKEEEEREVDPHPTIPIVRLCRAGFSRARQGEPGGVAAMMNRLATHRFLVPALMALAVFCVESAQGAAAFEGTLQVKRGGDGKVESAVLPAIAGKTSVDFHVVLDKSGLKMAEEAAGRAVKVKGSVSKKKKERWLTVKSFSLVLIGSAEVSRDDKRKMTSVVFTAEGWPSPFNVQIDSKAKLLAKGGGEKSFLVTGTLVELKEGEKVLKLETVFMLETLTGVVEVKETKKGKRRVPPWLWRMERARSTTSSFSTPRAPRSWRPSRTPPWRWWASPRAEGPREAFG